MTSSEAPPAAADRPSAAARAAAWLVSGAVIGLYVARAAGGHFGYTPFTDRDLVRAAQWREVFPASGAELSNGVGARVPGALLAFLMQLPRVLVDSPEAAMAFQVALAAASLAWLHVVAARRFGPFAAALGVAVLGGSFPFLDTTRTLWNPGFLPLFVVAMVDGVDRVVGARRPAGLVEVAAGAALGGQLHLSAWLAGVATLPGLVAARVPRFLRAVPWAVVAVVVAYLPFLVDEALHGFRATRLLLMQDVVHGRGLGRPWTERVGSELAILVGDPARELHRPVSQGVATALQAVNAVGAVVAVGAAVAAAVAVARGRGTPAARVLAAHASTAALVVVWYAADASLSVFARYLLVIAPGLALLAGAGLAAIPRLLGRLGRAGAAVGLVVAVGLAAVRALPLVAAFPPSERDWPAVVASLDRIEAETGWTLADLVGRTAWIDRGPDGELTLEATGLAVHDLLRREGATFRGSMPSPCAAVVTDRGRAQAAPDAATIATLVGGPTAQPTGVDELGSGRWLVRYTRAQGRCASTMGQRFLDRPAEESVRALYGRLPCGEVREVEDDGARRFVVFGGPPNPTAPCRHLGMAIDLRTTPGHVAAVLESNQLRGGAENTGWYFTARVGQPRLVLVGADGAQVELPFADGLVGLGHEVTPLSVERDVPAGTWRVELAMDVVADALQHGRAPEKPPRPLRVTLTDGLVVPAG